MGHIRYFDFDVQKVNPTTKREGEFMQLIRKCADRSISEFYYTHFDSMAANSARKQKRFKEYEIGLFNQSNISWCRQNDECLMSSPLFKKVGQNRIGQYMSSYGCVTNDCLLKEVRANMIPAIGHYIAVGAIEYMEEYLQMLECVYPTAFRGAYRSSRVQ